jgi:CDP-diacylglycerol--glycerol-3-phosphate 3-phosphatidyltransferase
MSGAGSAVAVSGAANAYSGRVVKAAPSQWNVANLVTIGRIVFVPFFAAALLVDDGQSVVWRLVATVLFVAAALTDKVDGYLARRYDLVTRLGALLDPIADKLLIGTALVILSAFGELSWWVTVVILVRELGITALRFVLLHRHMNLPVSRGGKWKTVLQSIAISIYLLPLSELPSWTHVIAAVAMGIAVAVTVVTGADYVRQAIALRHREPAR